MPKPTAAELAAAEQAAKKKPATDKPAADEPAGRETFGEVTVLSESDTHRVLQDERFTWKEAK